MRALIFILVFAICCHTGLMGQRNIDSLRKQLSTAREDTGKIKLLFSLVSEYVQNNTDSAIYLLEQGKKLIDKLNAHHYDFEHYFAGIKIYHATQDFERALQYNLKALNTAETDKNLNNKADALRALFTVYMNLKMDSLAIQTAHRALKLTEQLKDTVNLPITFGNLARLYYELGQYEKSITYGKKGIETAKKYNSLKGLLISLNNTAISNVELGHLDEGEKLYKEQLSVAHKNNVPRSVVKALVNLCFIAISRGNKQQLDLYTKKLNQFVTDHPDAPIASSDKKYLPLFTGYQQLFSEDYHKAEQEAIKGLADAQKDVQLQLNLYSLLLKINYSKHDFTKAQWYEEKSDSIEQVLLKNDLAAYELDIGKKYETEKKEARILLQAASIRQKNTLNYILIGGALALMIIITLGYRNYSHRQKIQQQRISELETEKHLTATEAVMKGEEQERLRLAKDLHDGLGGMLSGIKYSLHTMKGNLVLTPENMHAFERSIDMLDNSIKEMRRVAHNMMPEALVNFGLDTALKDFCNDIQQSGALRVHYTSIHMGNIHIEQTIAITAYRVVQELVNNAIKHANADSVIVQLSKHSHTISITVEDDGQGCSYASIQESGGIGWRNIKNRIDFLKGTIDLKSAPGMGTSILVELPV